MPKSKEQIKKARLKNLVKARAALARKRRRKRGKKRKTRRKRR